MFHIKFVNGSVSHAASPLNIEFWLFEFLKARIVVDSGIIMSGKHGFLINWNHEWQVLIQLNEQKIGLQYE